MLPGLPPLILLETVTADDLENVTVPASGTIAGHANFPAGAKHVVVMWNAKTVYAGQEGYALVQVNGDTGSNYDMQRLDGFGTSEVAYKETGIIGWSQIASMGAGDSTPAPGFIMVPNAFATTGYTAFIGMSAGHVQRARYGAGTWRNTAALTSMNFVAPATGGDTGLTGTFSLYVVDESYAVGTPEVLTGTSAFTNKSVPSQVGDISIINYCRSSRSATNDGIALDINTDTTATNYNNQQLYGYGGSATPVTGTNIWDNNQIGGCNASTADANYFSGALTTVNAFNYGANDPHALCLSGHVSVSAADGWCSLTGMQRNNVAAVTSVNVSPTVSSTFLAGSGQWVYAVPKILLDRQEIGAAGATSVTFTLSGYTIPATVKHLRLNYYGRSDRSHTATNIDVEINSSAANFSRQDLTGYATTVAAGQASDNLVGSMTADSATTNMFGGGTILFADYASTSIHKAILEIDSQNGSTYPAITQRTMVWAQTAAIATIVLKDTYDTDAKFMQGSIFELEGIGDFTGWGGNVMGVDDPAEVLGVEKANIETVMGVEAG